MHRAIVFINRSKWRHLYFQLTALCVVSLVYVISFRIWTPRPHIKLNFKDDTKVVRYTGRSWRTVPKFCSKTYDFDSVVLKTPAGDIPMYVRSSKRVFPMSVRSGDARNWDKEGLRLIFEQLKAESDMGLLDVGAHLGNFTLTAAYMGHKVTAIDPLVDNVIRLCRSIKENGLVDYVTLAIASLSRTSITLKRRETFRENDKEMTNLEHDKRKYLRYSLSNIHLDDMVYVIDFNKVFIKLDVETNVYFVLSGSKRLFLKLDVRGVLMRWDISKMNRMENLVIDFFTIRKFLPFSVKWTDHLLNPRLYHMWPSSVFWRKIDTV